MRRWDNEVRTLNVWNPGPQSVSENWMLWSSVFRQRSFSHAASLDSYHTYKSHFKFKTTQNVQNPDGLGTGQDLGVQKPDKFSVSYCSLKFRNKFRFQTLTVDQKNALSIQRSTINTLNIVDSSALLISGNVWYNTNTYILVLYLKSIPMG